MAELVHLRDQSTTRKYVEISIRVDVVLVEQEERDEVEREASVEH